MNCDGVQQNISSYLDNALDAEDVSAMFTHLGTCDRCREFIQSLLHLRTAFSALPREEVSASLDRRMYVMSRTTRSPRVGSLASWRDFLTRRLVFPLPVVAALTLVAFGGIILILSLWFGSASPREHVVYVLSIPAVEVHAPPSTTSGTIEQR